MEATAKTEAQTQAQAFGANLEDVKQPRNQAEEPTHIQPTVELGDVQGGSRASAQL